MDFPAAIATHSHVIVTHLFRRAIVPRWDRQTDGQTDTKSMLYVFCYLLGQPDNEADPSADFFAKQISLSRKCS